MSIVLAFGSETGDSTEATSANGTLDFAYTGWFHSGRYACRFNPAAAASLLRLRGVGVSGSPTELGLTTAYMSSVARFASLPNATIVVTGFVNSAGNDIWQIQLSAAGVLNLMYANGSNVLTSIIATMTVSLNTNYLIEVDALNIGTAGSASIACRINGVAYGSASSLTVRSAARTMDRTTHGLNTSHTVDWFIDDVIVDNAAAKGEVCVQHLLADGTGVNNQWDEGTGLTHAEVDDLPGHDVDGTYLKETTGGTTSYVTLEATGVDVQDGKILAFKAGIVVRDEGAVSSIRNRVRSGATNLDNTAADPGATYVLRQMFALTDPATTVAWTKAGIDAAQSAMVMTTGPVRCTAMWGEVVYQIPTAAGGGIPRAVFNYRQRRVL